MTVRSNWSDLHPTEAEHAIRMRQAGIVVSRAIGLTKCEVAEIGVRGGHHAAALLVAFPYAHLTLVDHYEPYGEEGYVYSRDAQDKHYHEAFDRLYPYRHRTSWVTRSSAAASALFADNFFDFVYIDADHRYESVRVDIASWYPKVAHGGYLGGHDYDASWSGVIRAVNEFAEREHLVLDAYGDWLVQKPRREV